MIGTLWTINDQIALKVADSFYASLAAAPGNAAQALHNAVHAVRFTDAALPSQWASYIHAGA